MKKAFHFKAKKKTFVRKKFHNFLKFFTRVSEFANSKNLQLFKGPNQKFLRRGQIVVERTSINKKECF